MQISIAKLARRTTFEAAIGEVARRIAEPVRIVGRSLVSMFVDEHDA